MRSESAWRWALWGGYALVLALAPWLLTSSLSHSLLSQMGIAIVLCLSYNILLGQGGMVSFGHAVYAGAGAFLAIHMLQRVGEGWPIPVSLIPIAGGVASMVVALVLGWATTQRSGTPFAMITFGMGELVWASALMFPEYFGGEGGISGNRVVGPAPWGLTLGPQIQLYYLIAVYTLVCTALMFAFTQTPLGRMLNAVRDNPERVAFVGYNPQRVRWLALVISAFFAGISGGLAALHFEMVSAEVFSAYRSGAYLLFTFVGGSTFFFGPVLGGVMMVLAFVLLPGLTPAWLLYLGGVFVGMVIYTPGGVAGLVIAGWRWAWLVADRRWLGRLWVPLVFTVSFGGAALGGFVALIEMIYLLQHSDSASTQLNLMGLQFDVHAGKSWCGAAAACAVGWGGFEWSRRHWVQRWGHLQQGAL